MEEYIESESHKSTEKQELQVASSGLNSALTIASDEFFEFHWSIVIFAPLYSSKLIKQVGFEEVEKHGKKKHIFDVEISTWAVFVSVFEAELLLLSHCCWAWAVGKQTWARLSEQVSPERWATIDRGLNYWARNLFRLLGYKCCRRFKDRCGGPFCGTVSRDW